MKPCSHSRSCVYYTQHNLFCLLPVKHKQLKGRRQRNLRPLCFWGLCIDFCIVLEFEGHPAIGVDSHRIDNGQPELFVKFGKRVQLLHLKYECANGIRLGLPCVLYTAQLRDPCFGLFVPRNKAIVPGFVFCLVLCRL